MRAPPFRPRSSFATEAAIEYRRENERRPVPLLPNGWQGREPAAEPEGAYNPPGAAIRVAAPNCDTPRIAVNLVCGASIIPIQIAWLWEGWLALGKLHLIGGQPGTGKTTIAVALAAVATRAAIWPDGTRCRHAGNVVIWSGEDDPADTLAPRLIAAGADMERVLFVEGVREEGRNRDFDPAKDIEPLRASIAKAGGAAMVIVDPIVSVVASDSHKNAETRRALQPLVDLCRDIGAALIGVTHFSKGTVGREPVERITGSLAFGALARIVLVAAKKSEPGENGDDDGKPQRLFARAKSNIGPDGGGFSYELAQIELRDHSGVMASHVVWGAALEGTARELLADAEAVDAEAGDELREAVTFLRELLSDGPVTTGEIKGAATGHAIAWRTVERAKKSLGIEAVRVNEPGGRGKGRWEWRLTSPTENSGSLGGLEPAKSSTSPSDGGLNDEGDEL